MTETVTRGKANELCAMVGVVVSEEIQAELRLLDTILVFLATTREMAEYDVAAATDDPREAGLQLPAGFLIDLNKDLTGVLEKWIEITTAAAHQGAAAAHRARVEDISHKEASAKV